MANQTKIMVEGTLHEILPVQEIPTASGTFKKQEIVIICQKPNNKEEYFKGEVSGDMFLAYLATLQKGDKVSAKMYVNGRKYTKDNVDSYFISLAVDYLQKVE